MVYVIFFSREKYADTTCGLLNFILTQRKSPKGVVEILLQHGHRRKRNNIVTEFFLGDK